MVIERQDYAAQKAEEFEVKVQKSIEIDAPLKKFGPTLLNLIRF
jgi:hypothetical protein